MLTFIALALALNFSQSAQAPSGESKICDMQHLWTTPEQDAEIRRCEDARTPEERLARSQAREPGRVGGMINSQEHREIRVLAMNKKCAEAMPRALATNDQPLIQWVRQMCGAAPQRQLPRQQSQAPVQTERKQCPMVQLWTSAEEGEAIRRCEAERDAITVPAL